MTYTVLVVYMSYLIFVTPCILLDILDSDSSLESAFLQVPTIYFIQIFVRKKLGNKDQEGQYI